MNTVIRRFPKGTKSDNMVLKCNGQLYKCGSNRTSTSSFDHTKPVGITTDPAYPQSALVVQWDLESGKIAMEMCPCIGSYSK